MSFLSVFAMPLSTNVYCALWSPAGRSADLLAIICGV